MNFVRVKSGTWVNLMKVEHVAIWHDHCKRPEGSEEEKCRWKVLLIVDQNDPYTWKHFETKEDAQNWLDTTLPRIINDGQKN